jgi:hypothetical protein
MTSMFRWRGASVNEALRYCPECTELRTKVPEKSDLGHCISVLSASTLVDEAFATQLNPVAPERGAYSERNSK